jgi:hypothetical protein
MAWSVLAGSALVHGLRLVLASAHSSAELRVVGLSAEGNLTIAFSGYQYWLVDHLHRGVVVVAIP